MSQDKHLVRDIERLRHSIKRKHRELTHNILDEEQSFVRHAKPIIEPLMKLVDLGEGGLRTPKEEPKNEPSVLLRQYLNIGGDKCYGIHFDNVLNQWRMGNKSIQFHKDTIVVDGKHNFQGSKGLYELLFQSKPERYTHKDFLHYKKILDLTDAHRNKLGRIKVNVGYKYRNIIRKMYMRKKLEKQNRSQDDIVPKSAVNTDSDDTLMGGMETEKIGKGFMIEDIEAPTKYIYWDDPNELCDRLRMLIMSKQAGHTGHTSEIASIIEELREKGYITRGELII